MKFAFLSQTISLLALRGTLEVKAARLLEPCNADCDCEGALRRNGEGAYVNSIRCEMRHIPLGKRCYQDFSLSLNEPCTKDSECKSQWCANGICTIHAEKPPVTGLCRYDQKVVGIVNRKLEPKDGTCPCANPQESSVASAQSMFGSNPSKDTYSNNYGEGSGLELIPITSGPVRSMRICSGDGSYMRDPTSYKLEGLCRETNRIEIIEGTINFRRRDYVAKKGTGKYKKECTVVKISHKSFFSRYNITFPTQRGGDPTCSGNSNTCQNYATEFSELSLYGPCAYVEAAPSSPTVRTPAPIPSPTARTPGQGGTAAVQQGGGTGVQQAAPSPTARTPGQGGTGGEQREGSTCKYELSITTLVNGAQPTGSTNCPCAHPHHASMSDAQSMVAFENPSLDTYSNNFGLGSGLEFTAKTSGPLRTMRICSGDGPYMRDPTSFKLESRCQPASAFKVFQEGPLRFPIRERSVQSGTGAAVKECIEVQISDTTSCNEYRITFPTQRGRDATCSLVDACQNYPTEFSELSFSAPCSEIGAIQ